MVGFYFFGGDFFILFFYMIVTWMRSMMKIYGHSKSKSMLVGFFFCKGDFFTDVLRVFLCFFSFFFA